MEVTALDEAGKKVDWFFIYKVPELAAGATTDKTTGYEYVPKIHTMAHLPPRTGAPFHGRLMPLEPEPEPSNGPSRQPIQEPRPKKKAKKKQPTKKK
jgi:hypothetical protein